MRMQVTRPFTYTLNGTEHVFDAGEADVPADVAEVAAGAGWATVLDVASAPATKARRGAPENE